MNIVKYFEEMSWVMKIVWGGLFVVVVGFIVTSSDESAQQKQSMAYLRARDITVEYARETCKKSIEDHVTSDLGYPSRSDTDPMGAAATLIWQDDGQEFTSIVCRYHKDKGLTSLSIDGTEKLGPTSSETGSQNIGEAGKAANQTKAGTETAVKVEKVP